MYRSIVLILIFSTTLIIPQSDPLDKYTAKMEKKISVGMSTAEVKAAIGKPFGIESGFPDRDYEVIFSEFPEMKGQLNYTSWIYKMPNIYRTHAEDGSEYYINGSEVSSVIYKDYEGKDTVCVCENETIFPSTVDQYKLLGKIVCYVPIDYKTTYVRKLKPKKVKSYYTPLVYVIFDKGTQVVAGVKIYYVSV